MNWFEKIFSIDEVRVSALVVCLIAVIASCIVSYFLLGDVHSSLVSLAETLIYAVTGLSGIGIGASAYKSVANSKTVDTSSSNSTLGTYTPDDKIPPKI